MQGHLHHQQQQQHHLAAFLSAATAGDITSSADGDRPRDADRVAALESLHRAILYPPNSLIVAHSAPFLAQGLFQLLSDQCYAVRLAASVAYGSLCSIICSTSLNPNTRQNLALHGGLVDRFIAWALPLVREVVAGDSLAELALEGLREFLTNSDAAGVDRYALSILKSCQELLEDERTSLNLLHQLLGMLSLLSVKCWHCFHSHFVDIVDLLLGWALMPDLPESDKFIIMETFLQFKNHWTSDMQVPIKLLSKFLGDMEVLIQDKCVNSSKDIGRLLALFSCFSTVLQASTTGLLETDYLNQIREPLRNMIPQLLACLLLVGKKAAWEKWTGESWKCLILLARIFQENFSCFYLTVVDIFFQSLKVLPTSQVPGVLKANLQLLSLQKFGLCQDPIKKLLNFDSSFSLLRLHPNHLVVGNSVETYLFFLQHGLEPIKTQAITCMMEELEVLRNVLEESSSKSCHKETQVSSLAAGNLDLVTDSFTRCSLNELISLFKFDLKFLLGCLCASSDGKMRNFSVTPFLEEKSVLLMTFICEKLNPFEIPIQDFLGLQVHVLNAMRRLSEVELLYKLKIYRDSCKQASESSDYELQRRQRIDSALTGVIFECLNKYDSFLVRCLHSSSPLAVKEEALEWIGSFCGALVKTPLSSSVCDTYKNVSVNNNVLSAILDAASDREEKVRTRVALVLEQLLHANIIHPGNFYLVAEVALDRLGDPEFVIKHAFTRVLANVLPASFLVHGIFSDRSTFCCRGPTRLGKNLNWKQTLALMQFPRQLKSQHLVTILSYISQRWKVPLSSWINRLMFSRSMSKDPYLDLREEARNLGLKALLLGDLTDEILLEKMCSENNLAALWWCIHEAAKYIVSLRLRTNLGGPAQTFAALERMLLDVSHMLLLDTEHSDGNLSMGNSRIHLLPMRLLLYFVESLKKHVYNAYEGSSVLPHPTRQSSLFFVANKKVCEEWFSRISDPMLNAGLALQCHDAVLCYSVSRLQDLQNAWSSSKERNRSAPVSENAQSFKDKLALDTMKLLRHAALALCRMREPEALVGLHSWALLTFSSLFAEENQLNSGKDGSLGHFMWIIGLVHQAHGRYEKAAAHFSHLLQSEEVLTFMGSEGIQFVIERIIESYTAISDWKSLETWLSELQSLRAKHAGKVYSGALTAAGNEINAIHALACFDEGDAQAAWSYLDLTPKSCNELTVDPKLALERSEQIFLRAMLQKDAKIEKVTEKVENAELMLYEVLSVAPLDGLAVVAPYATQLHCLYAFMEGLKLGSSEKVSQFSPMLGSMNCVMDSPISKVHQDCSLWLKVFRVYRTVFPTSPITLFLCQKLVTLARKQSNFMLAERMTQYLRDNITKSSQGDLSNLLYSNLQYESIRLNYAAGNHADALTNMWLLVRRCILSPGTLLPESCKMMYANACLKLSTWLKQEYSSINLGDIIKMIYSDMIQSDTIGGDLSRNRCMLIGNDITFMSNSALFLEELVGICIKSSCNLCPTMGKAWLSYASWCYNQARSSVSSDDTFLRQCSPSHILSAEFPPDRFHLNEEEMSTVTTVVENFFYLKSSVEIENGGDGDGLDLLLSQDMTTVNTYVQRAIYLIESSAGSSGVEDCNGECPASVLESELRSLFLHANSDTNIEVSHYVDQLLNVWKLLRQRRVSLFGHSAFGYLQYLSYSFPKLEGSPMLQYNRDFSRENSGSCSLRAALYVLNIILKYGTELHQMIEPGLALVPMLPWQEITPQIFARLVSHPQKEVRRLLENILMMLARSSPSSIVYPALVDTKNIEGEPPEELQRLLDCLDKLYPQLIKDARLVINELGNITVLWEEQWLSTLQDLHSDAQRRINMLKEEIRRIAENVTLSQSEKNKINAAKYCAVMAPVVVALERRLQSTSREPQTPHEEWFQKEYGEQLKCAITNFKTPPLALVVLGDAWRPFEAIAASLLNYQRKSLVTMSEVAPRLATLSASEVPMPGLEKQISLSDSAGASGQIQGLVTVSSFLEKITILSTKTKPKKIVIQGSNGQRYAYLLKGREDLRLDARIMQLLQAVNSFLYSCTNTRSRSLDVRYYSVTPISGRAGLIQWLDNVVSVYSVFKTWQQHAQVAHFSANGGSNMDRVVPTVPRPSDMFYGKIIPALKEKGIKRVISRKDWPHEVKRKVLLDLMREVPKELLYREIWCASEGFAAYSSKLKRFSSSVATMSMVGHILGLGDRHLDNILVDFFSGDMIHIDYNICFDKGRRLKIPEIVPFRLTQTIEAALGLTGTEGTFKANCEAVMGILRKNKDVLLMMLDVFVWDPLIEWTRGDADDEAAIGGEEKKGMDLAVSLSLFASRFHEIRVPLQEHHDLLLTTLPAVESVLEKFLNVLNQYEIVSSIFYHAEQERSRLVHHETSAKSAAAEATSISEKARASYEIHSHEFTQAKVSAIEKAQEASKWMEQHARVLDALRSNSVPIAQAFVKLSEEAVSLTSAVIAAGVPLTVVPEPTQAQCYELDREVSGLLKDLDNGLSLAVEALQQYSLALQRILPLNYITSSPVNGWSRILQLSTTNLSSELFSLARRQAAELITNGQGDANESVQQRHRELFLDMENYVSQIEGVKDEYLKLENSVGPETEVRSKERLLSAFTKFMHTAGFARKDDDVSISHASKLDIQKHNKVHNTIQEKRQEILAIIHTAATALFQDVKTRVFDICGNAIERVGWKLRQDACRSNSRTFFHEFEEQIEKCTLFAGLVKELQQIVGFNSDELHGIEDMMRSSEQNWVSIFQECLRSCSLFVEKMTEAVLPEVIKLALSYHAEVMEAFGSLSQIRGSTDTALEQLIEVHLERVSLEDLEENYFSKVEVITKQQLALEEAAKQGRDHLSWEEAEELAIQEEACRAQLDRLRQSWNQREMLRSSLEKRETSIRLSLVASERKFLSMLGIEHGNDPRASRSKVLLNMLVQPFDEFEPVDQLLPSYATNSSYLMLTSPDSRSFGSLSESVWKFGGLLRNHSFFLWKVNVVDSVLDSCVRDISSFVDHNLGFDQLHNILKRKLGIQLQECISQYLKDRVASSFMLCLEKKIKHLKQLHQSKKGVIDQAQKGSDSVAEVQRMVEEYCNTHETARSTRSAMWLLKRQKSELTDSLRTTILEIVQLEWFFAHALSSFSRMRVLSQDVVGENILDPLILNLDRLKIIENLQSSISSIAKAVDYLQLSERTSVSAETQLERAMGWACAGSNISGSNLTKNPGIPPEFHDHIIKRRNLLRGAQEQATNIMNVCKSVLEFETSRDGLSRILGEVPCGHPIGDSRLWQQVYMNALTRLDAAYHSFKVAEQEWMLAQKNMDVAADNLFSAASELSIASVKAKSAAGEFESILIAMKDCAFEVNAALTTFSHVSRGQTILTSECGTMLEEVLSISEGLHDINKLAKEAAVVHNNLVADLSKVVMILLPLETSLSTDVAAVACEKDENTGITAVHGQLLYKSYSSRVRESFQASRSLVPLVTSSVKELHGMLIKLVKIAGLHAKNLHKALEGLGESQDFQSQDLALSSDMPNTPTLYGDKIMRGISGSQGDELQAVVELKEFSLLDEDWISPPDTIYSSSLESSGASTEVGLSEKYDKTDQYSDSHIPRDSTESSGSFCMNYDGGASTDNLELGSMKDDDNSTSSGPAGSLNLMEREGVSSVQDGTIMSPFIFDSFDMDKDILKNRKHSDGKGSATVTYQENRGHDFNHEGFSNIIKGKNAYAVSVLRQVEKKIDGRDINDSRPVSILEQVEYLIKQATSIDNLCNMYEGWTPWI